MSAEDNQGYDDDKVRQLFTLQNRKQIVHNEDLKRAETFDEIYLRLSKEEIFVRKFSQNISRSFGL
jgi:hypothetical protein